MSEPTRYLKVVSGDHKACHGGVFDYAPHLPNGDEPGLELPHREPNLCHSGWHWCEPDWLMHGWTYTGMQVYEAEPSDDVTPFDDEGKCVSSSGRLLRPYALPQWWTDAMRFIEAEIRATPWYTCQGEPNPEWRLFLADNWDSARDSAWDSAWDSALASAWVSAWDSARVSARASAWASARDSARASAWDSAWDSALASAWDSARVSARASAWASARDSARDSAWVSAWDSALASALYVTAVHICAGTGLDISAVEHARARWDVWQRGYALLCDVDGVLYVYGVRK